VFPTNAVCGITGDGWRARKQLRQVTPHPMHYDDGVCGLCLHLEAGQIPPKPADFLPVTIDNSGAAEIVYGRTSKQAVSGKHLQRGSGPTLRARASSRSREIVRAGPFRIQR